MLIDGEVEDIWSVEHKTVDDTVKDITSDGSRTLGQGCKSF